MTGPKHPEHPHLDGSMWVEPGTLASDKWKQLVDHPGIKIERRPFRIHHLKTWPGPFQAILDGRKTHEVRKDDRGFEIGDVLCLVEWDPSPKSTHEWTAIGATGRELRVVVTYISRAVHGLPENLIVMSVRPEPGP